MESILFLLLELQRAQMSLTHLQSGRSAHIEVRHVRALSAPSVQSVAMQPTSTPLPFVTAASPVQQPSTQVVQQQLQQASQPAPQAAAPTISAAEGDVHSQIEQYVFADTNAFRAQNGLPALSSDANVAAVARAHSADMLAQNYFEHSNLEGCDPGCRLTNAGYTWHSYGENIHWMQGYNLSASDSAQKIVNDWINSPPHRANLLGAFTYAGVGIAVSGDKIYSTTDYTSR